MSNMKKFSIVLAILFASLMLVSAVSAAENIQVSDQQDDMQQVTIDNGLSEDNNLQEALYLKDSTVKAGNVTPKLHVNVNKEVIGSSAYVRVTVEGSNIFSKPRGNVTFSVDGTPIADVRLTNTLFTSYASYIFEDLEEGTHNISVRYNGDNRYKSVEDTKEITVQKLNPTLNINVFDFGLNNEFTVIASLHSDKFLYKPTGEIRLSLNGTTPIVLNLSENFILDRFVTYTYDNLTSGEYTVYVYYDGDEYFNPVNGTVSFNVTKFTPELIVDVDNVNVGDVEVNVLVNDYHLFFEPTGTVSFRIDEGNWIPVELKEIILFNRTTPLGPVASYTFKGLAPGVHTLYVRYDGDDYFNPVIENRTIKVMGKVVPKVIINVDDVIIGPTVNVGVVVDGPDFLPNPTGTVSFSINGEDWYTENLTGTFIINPMAFHRFSDVATNEYNLTVRYSGDEYYQATEASQKITVTKITPKINVNVDEIVYGEELDLRIVLTDDELLYVPTGTIAVSIDGENWTTFNLNQSILLNPYVECNFTGLKEGEYTISINYSGDRYFNPTTLEKTVFLTKIQPTLIIDVDDVVVGTDVKVITIVKDDELFYRPTGTISFSVDGKNWINKTLNKGIPFNPFAECTFPDLEAKEYTVYVKYSGDKYFKAAEGQKTFNVTKITPKLHILVANDTIGPNVYVRASLSDDELFYTPTGNISFRIDSGDWIEQPISKGIIIDPYATATFKGLKEGKHTIEVKYSGDKYFNPVEGQKIIYTTKITPIIDINVNTFVVGTADVRIVIEDDELLYGATGNVRISLDNGKSITVPIKHTIFGATATYRFENLTNSTHTLSVEYDGDDYFYGAKNATSFDVELITPKLIIDVDDVNLGDVKINVFFDNPTLFYPPKGNIQFSIDDGKNWDTVPIEIFITSYATITYKNLTEGSYKVLVRYDGDNHYNPATASADFYVEEKVKPQMTIDVRDVYTYGRDTRVGVILEGPEFLASPKGKVSFQVDDGEVVTVTLSPGIIFNPLAYTTFKGLNPGNHTLKIKYEGDRFYSSIETTKDFKVVGKAPTIREPVSFAKGSQYLGYVKPAIETGLPITTALYPEVSSLKVKTKV